VMGCAFFVSELRPLAPESAAKTCLSAISAAPIAAVPMNARREIVVTKVSPLVVVVRTRAPVMRALPNVAIRFQSPDSNMECNNEKTADRSPALGLFGTRVDWRLDQHHAGGPVYHPGR